MPLCCVIHSLRNLTPFIFLVFVLLHFSGDLDSGRLILPRSVSALFSGPGFFMLVSPHQIVGYGLYSINNV